jgi:beta-aspartyl-peptidase (threonine type)
MLSESDFKRVTIIAHSGVSGIFKKEEELKKGLLISIKCALLGFDKLAHGLSATDAVEASVNFMEASGHVNAGAGSVVQADGIQRMDASIMNSKLECGCVSQIQGYLHPISIARKILEKKYTNLGFIKGQIPDHIYFDSERVKLIADFNNATKFDINSYQKIDLTQLEEEFRFFKLIKRPEPLIESDETEDDVGSDTVGAVALDFQGSITAGTSTGGRGNCLPGRIGDSPIIGAGTYCNSAGGASMTGYGEDVIRNCCSKRVIDLIKYNEFNAQLAVDRMLKEFKEVSRNSLGAIAIDHKGNFGVGMLGVCMNWAAVTALTNGKGLVLDKEIHYGSYKGMEIVEKERKKY